MTPVETFLICLGVGAALIAFWLVLRFPERAPGDFKRAFLHVGLAMLAGWLASNLFDALVAYGFAAAVAGVFVVVFPVLIYSFLASAWFLKLAHDMLSQYRR
jgi:uncharacterized transporter YbjL